MDLPAGEVRRRFAEVVDRVRHEGERVYVTRNRKRVAVIMSVEDAERLSDLEDRADIAIAGRVMGQIARGRETTVPWEAVKRRARKR